jgi:hypothetical protein
MKTHQELRIYAITPDAYGVYVCSAQTCRSSLLISELSRQNPTWQFFGYVPATRLTAPGGFTHEPKESNHVPQAKS